MQALYCRRTIPLPGPLTRRLRRDRHCSSSRGAWFRCCSSVSQSPRSPDGGPYGSFKLVNAGQPNPERFKNLLTTRTKYAMLKIIGQKKLLQWSGPGRRARAHVLGLPRHPGRAARERRRVLLAALRAADHRTHSWLRRRSSTSSAPPSALSLIAFALIRVKNNPKHLAAQVAVLRVPHGTGVPDPLPDLPRRHDAARSSTRRAARARPTCRTPTARSSRGRSATCSRASFDHGALESIEYLTLVAARRRRRRLPRPRPQLQAPARLHVAHRTCRSRRHPSRSAVSSRCTSTSRRWTRTRRSARVSIEDFEWKHHARPCSRAPSADAVRRCVRRGTPARSSIRSCSS